MKSPAPTRRRGGPKPRFDEDTAAARRREQNVRGQIHAREITSWLREHHPTIYEEASAHATQIILDLRGPLPGDPVPDTRRRSAKG